jgi:hypothetical protein
MGRHDQRSHWLHIPKQTKFKQAAPHTGLRPTQAPQVPQPGTGSLNHFRTDGNSPR